MIENMTFLKSVENSESEDENFFNIALKRVKKNFPQGMMFDYCGISFYVKDYSVCEDLYCNFAESNESKLWLICEYFDEVNNEFKEKYFFEDFLKNRMLVLQGTN